MRHSWYMLRRDNMLLPEAWRCRGCPAGSFSAHLLDEEGECPMTGAPDYELEHKQAVERYFAEAAARRRKTI